MGLKCSVLGHSYGETTVEREREEQGSEVVISITEVETCNRCGKERVVSENKEVTAIETPDDDLEADETTPDDTPPEESQTDTESTVDDDVDDAVETPPAPPESDAAAGAEILDAESDEPVDGESVDDELTDPSLGGDEELDDDPVDAPTETDDAVIIDEESAETDDGDRQPGEWPEEPEKADDDWKPDTMGIDGGAEEESEEAAAGGEGPTVTIPDGQFRCPECGYTTLVESSSLRSGDFCPECRRGTLVHEPEDETRKE